MRPRCSFPSSCLARAKVWSHENLPPPGTARMLTAQIPDRGSKQLRIPWPWHPSSPRTTDRSFPSSTPGPELFERFGVKGASSCYDSEYDHCEWNGFTSSSRWGRIRGWVVCRGFRLPCAPGLEFHSSQAEYPTCVQWPHAMRQRWQSSASNLLTSRPRVEQGRLAAFLPHLSIEVRSYASVCAREGHGIARATPDAY